MLWCPILPERRPKFEMIMRPLASGWRSGARVCFGAPPNDDNPIVAYGQAWGSEKLLRDCTERDRVYWHIDNGFCRPGRGRPHGYYRFAYRSMSPKFLPNADSSRARALGIELKPWRKDGAHILLALPGADFGRGIGMNMPEWIVDTRSELPRATSRPIVIRDRQSPVPVEQHFRNCWALVTHSSNIAVDAVIAGIPVFVAPTSAAAPVGNLNWDALERPAMPDRQAWLNSLAVQQFTPAEMGNGTAYDHLLAIAGTAA